jgi:hypothetical protein
MADYHLKSYREKLAERERREDQRRLYLRNQVLGMVLLLAAIVVWWLICANPKWIFPAGWWRP